jgi:hypothetical protein
MIVRHSPGVRRVHPFPSEGANPGSNQRPLLFPRCFFSEGAPHGNSSLRASSGLPRPARIAPDALAIIRRAAEIQGRSVSDFVVATAQEAAQQTIEKTDISVSWSGARGPA